MACAESLWQYSKLLTALNSGFGFTVMVKLIVSPVQLLALLFAVTVMVDVTGNAVVFSAVKLAILPLPLAAKPISVLLDVQLKVVPEAALVKLVILTVSPAHTTISETWFVVAAGFTVTNTVSVAVQPPARVTVKV